MNQDEHKDKWNIKSWLHKRLPTAKTWLFNRILLAGLGFFGLNALDGTLTNYTHQMYVQSGLLKTLEANPVMSPLAGHWALSFKGILGVGALAILAKIKKSTPNRLYRYLLFGCLAVLGYILWIHHSLGVLP